MKKTLAVILLILMAVLNLAAADKTDKQENQKRQPVNTTEINWLKYDEGLVRAEKLGRPIMVYFTTSWCGYCKKMQKETFVRPEVIKFLNESFVSIKVNGDSKYELDVNGYKITERNLARAEFRVSGYPAFWFLKSDGEKIGPAKGYKPTHAFLDITYYVKDELYDSISFAEYVKNGGYKVNK